MKLEWMNKWMNGFKQDEQVQYGPVNTSIRVTDALHSIPCTWIIRYLNTKFIILFSSL